jgi:pseudomonalisin
MVKIHLKPLGALAIAWLTLCLPAIGQNWTSTATKAFPVTNATLLGSLDPSTPLHVAVGLQMQNAGQVQPMLKSMITPGDPLYGTSLTVSQFVAQFAPTAAQVQAVTSYLSAQGFTNINVEENQLLVEADATAGQVEAAFNTTLAAYSVNGNTVFANTSDAQVPASLGGLVVAVLGLNNLVGMHSDLIKATDPCTPASCPTPNVNNETFTPWQYQIAYDAAVPGATPAATNLQQKVATGSATAIGIIVEGDLGTVSPTNPTDGTPSASSTGVIHDLYLFEQAFKLPAAPVTIVHAGIPSPDTSGADEWDLDSQSSTGIALQVKHLYFYVATSLTDSDIAVAIHRAVTDNKVKGFNMSFGECEFLPFLDGAMLVDDEAFAEAALQGMTPFASSDDQGSACPVGVGANGIPLSGAPDTSYPASSPYVVAVGGTNLFTNTDYTYNQEVAWEASGGGPSYFENPPFWQADTGSGTEPIVPSAAASIQGGRGVPDVSMCAGGTELAICAAITYVGGTQELVGGTSLSSPLAMGSWARIQTAHKNKLGFAAPLIYQLANGAGVVSAPSSPFFNDVLTGSNGLFSALPGYDYVTGLGSWDILIVNNHIPSAP